MPFQTIAVILIAIGIIALTLSLRPAWRLQSQMNNKGWHLLFGLILLFIVAYIGSIYRVIITEQVQPIGVGFSLILFFGSIFVYLATTMFLKSLLKLKSVANEYEHALSHDSLTLLPNRSSMLKSLEEQVAKGETSTLFIIDIMHFKRVNDTLGNQYGDKLLCHVSLQLTKRFGNLAKVGRVGGNEFAIIVFGKKNTQLSYVVGELKRLMNTVVSLDDFQVNSDLAIGMSSFPQHASNIDELIEQASIALEQSKQESGKIVEYDSNLRQLEDSQPSLLKMLLEDLDSDKLNVHYQPIINSSNNEMVAVEALSRWPKRGGGFVPPNLFVPLLEQANKVSHLTLWLISKIAEDLPYLIEQYQIESVHINLSAKDLMSQRVQLALEWHSINTPNFADSVCLEITESAAFEQNETTEHSISTLTKLGYTLSLDDFGTGYSSLSLLRKLPVEQVKLDRSFVSNISESHSDYNIVKTMIELGHVLGYSVVAEGVETSEIANELEKLGCDYQQGYLYSPAVPLEELDRFSLKPQSPKLRVISARA